MNDSTSSVEFDLRISPRTILSALVALGVLLYFGVTALSGQWELEGRMMTLFLALCGLAITGWLLTSWKPLLGRWFTVLALSAAVHLAGLGLDMPGSLAWAAIPVALAVPLVGLSAASVAMEAGLWGARNRPEDIHWGWESPTCQLRGHFLGHWLSAAARIFANTGNTQIKARADHIVSELARCQEENGGGWAGSIPEKYLDWITRGKRVWTPHFTLHKTLMGLCNEERTLYGDKDRPETILAPDNERE